ncbi:enoyl-CoA hydratase-related protein [Hoeflea prorocentri]|uniref:Enoyl-CoA hydratase-related protein n=1 Tax=Hoeflea prorocentri TaxID=1922333 RepID=A0A9X3ZGT4_9HYPH|nr:enoyl-CoA hydratase-related protein [Hoeflea prorocentri]MCY6380146.1 enoyl-CoA hydratase-related protein [Hoeflea prorocentri]MDA5397946.1 enoyl-CoA hydratase-related protein [Hoeflea prorocentri]
MSVTFTQEGGVARITIDRPDRMNAVDLPTEEAMEAAWSRIEADSSVRCVVLTGSGDRAFCAGADLKSDAGKSGLEYWAERNPNGFGGISMRKNLKVPVIARVNGLALGGGMEMVLGCDIVIASETARFGLPEAKVGRVPLDGGMIMLQRLIPEKIATGLMMTGRMMPADEAAKYGLVNAVVAADELDTEVDRWVADILACAPLSVSAIKATIRKTGHLTQHEAYAARLPELVAALTSEDADEGVTAFREKRPPEWKGR